MDSAKLKKLQEYSAFLIQQAESKEATGNKSEAVKDYVKLVDVLLLLANETKDHPGWQQLIGRAEYYQKKARSMVGPENAGQPMKPSDSYEIKQVPKPTGNGSQVKSVAQSSYSFNPFRKFPSLIGRKSDAKNPVDADSSDQAPNVISSWAKDLNSKSISASSSSETRQVSALQAVNVEDETVPRTLYAKLLDEKATLQREVESLRDREREYLSTIEVKERQFSETISQMVPKSEFEELRAKLADSVPRSEYEQARSISAIPRERYIELQSEITELEVKLQNSVPRMIIDEIADYVSFLVSTVSSITDENSKLSLEGNENKQFHG